mgnify:CR=1 FL=1
MTATNILVPLLSGFEELEATTIVDVLRRADLSVWLAADEPGPVRGAHNIRVVADKALARVSAKDLRAVVLPGGMPGAKNLAEHPIVQRLIAEVYKQGGYVAAVCAAPMALAAAGVLAGKSATCYPGFEKYLEGAKISENRVVVDGKVVTSRGPGTAQEFALTLVGLLRDKNTETEVQEALLTFRP